VPLAAMTPTANYRLTTNEERRIARRARRLSTLLDGQPVGRTERACSDDDSKLLSGVGCGGWRTMMTAV